ncbi:hypothetical protein X769_13685 [Mesorhizobium sp. LSJC268A00]|nr:hypothetical protein X769_13685 [Mesorhizobium sp. LSJC268A00]ESX46876.1 hypothetical protein X762_20145 [Mesorhizobium sp. LSHC426A00]ESX57020.1 hypothetical protein X760_22775 [Mesorhizobium sp. LSHC422A00]ESX59242.1 hypothetical protein X761_00480 [Mesorhizobium sp. LSHC424B00]ESX72304.1 hypothetical protein X758_12610 [Mesorhizobium sp. LSHC416B00]ESX78517.1 hypothetical protein X757_09405 [Mesorhizobium sp. LSHC414A00]ESZ63220.1 hypothetical protein X729_07665 [Mesorhizobium sp. L103C
MKVGMAPTADKTVAMFMRYIHNEDDPVPSPIDCDVQRAGNHRARAGGCRSRAEQRPAWPVSTETAA